jgi:RNA polymerase sigma-70 factor (ECF subfamily)
MTSKKHVPRDPTPSLGERTPATETASEGDAQQAQPAPDQNEEEVGMQMAATPALQRGLTRGGPRSVKRESAVDATTATARLAALYREHHRLVFKSAWRVTGDAQDAEDVLQTVFLRMAREGLPTDLDNPAAYLNRAAINAGLDVVRARKRRKIIPLEAPRSEDGPARLRGEAEDVAHTATDGAPDRDAAHAAAELRAKLRTAVGTLSPRVAEIFALRYFEGWGNREIAAQLDTSESSIGVTLFRARKQVAAALAETGADHGAD